MSTDVLVVDDSALVRKLLTRELEKDGDINVVGAAPDPYVARDKIVELDPDVMTLDIEMPKMDGLTFLGKIMKHNPMPVVVVSSLSQEGSEVAMKAVETGAVEVVGKPDSDVSSGIRNMGQDLAGKVKSAARVNISTYQQRFLQSDSEPQTVISDIEASDKIIAIGSSTGGVQALKQVIPKFPGTAPGTLVVQHMPSGFTDSFSQSLDEMSQVDVSEAQDGERLRQGKVLIAPGNQHLMVQRSGAQYRAQLKDGPLVCRQRPAAEVLFKSVAKSAGVNAVGVIMTGMGDDGAEGLLQMREAGAATLGQDEESSTVYGMPKEAYNIGAVEEQISLENLAERIIQKVKAPTGK